MARLGALEDAILARSLGRGTRLAFDKPSYFLGSGAVLPQGIPKGRRATLARVPEYASQQQSQ